MNPLNLQQLSMLSFMRMPFMYRPRPCREDDTSASSSAGLLLQKDVLYTAIRDLEFDFQTGKVDQQGYAELRQHLEREAVHVLRLLDALDPCTALEASLEQQVALLRPSACLICGAELQRNEPCCPSCAQEPRKREEKHVVRPPI